MKNHNMYYRILGKQEMLFDWFDNITEIKMISVLPTYFYQFVCFCHLDNHPRNIMCLEKIHKSKWFQRYLPISINSKVFAILKIIRGINHVKKQKHSFNGLVESYKKLKHQPMYWSTMIFNFSPKAIYLSTIWLLRTDFVFRGEKTSTCCNEHT